MGLARYRLPLILLATMQVCGCAAESRLASGADHLLLGGLIQDDEARRRNEVRYRADIEACGFWAGAEWCRLGADDRNISRMYPAAKGGSRPPGEIVFDPSQCSAPLVGGRCLASLIIKPLKPASCHGQMIDGVCSGPIF